MIDRDWFQAAHRRAGVSQRAAAARMGRQPGFLSRLYNGQQAMRLPEARELADILKVPLADVLRAAGLDASSPPADAPPTGALGEANVEYLPNREVAAPKAQGPRQTVWRVRSGDMRAAGFLPGDVIVVDDALQPRRGDAVLAQLYDLSLGSAETVLRLYLPPYLVRPGLEAETPLAVDGERVLVRGVVSSLVRRRMG